MGSFILFGFYPNVPGLGEGLFRDFEAVPFVQPNYVLEHVLKVNFNY